MPALASCSCPNCHHLINVPSEIVGKDGLCPHCRAQFRIKEVGGKTLLKAVPVDGYARTTLAAPMATRIVSPRMTLSTLVKASIWLSCALLVFVETIRFMLRPTWRDALRSGPENQLVTEAFDGVLGPIGMTVMAYVLARAATSIVDLFTKHSAVQTWH